MQQTADYSPPDTVLHRAIIATTSCANDNGETLLELDLNRICLIRLPVVNTHVQRELSGWRFDQGELFKENVSFEFSARGERIFLLIAVHYVLNSASNLWHVRVLPLLVHSSGRDLLQIATKTRSPLFDFRCGRTLQKQQHYYLLLFLKYSTIAHGGM